MKKISFFSYDNVMHLLSSFLAKCIVCIQVQIVTALTVIELTDDKTDVDVSEVGHSPIKLSN